MTNNDMKANRYYSIISRFHIHTHTQTDTHIDPEAGTDTMSTTMRDQYRQSVDMTGPTERENHPTDWEMNGKIEQI